MARTAFDHQSSARHAARWHRLGWAGFLFFLLKGLAWLVAPALIYYLS